MKNILIPIAVSAAISASAGAIASDNSRWGSVQENDYGSFYIQVDSQRYNNRSLMFYAHPEQDCRLAISWTTRLEGYASDEEFQGEIKVRIDKRPVRHLDVNVVTAGSDTFRQVSERYNDGAPIHMQQSTFYPDDRFLNQFVTGKKLIIKSESQKTDSFTLNGSSQRFSQLFDACQADVDSEWADNSGSNEWSSQDRENYDGPEWES